MSRRLVALLVAFFMIISIITPFARSKKSQNFQMLPPEYLESRRPFYFCSYVIPHNFIWVSLRSSLYNDCFGNYAMTIGTNAWWPAWLANPGIVGGWAVVFAGWQYPKNIGDHASNQIVYDQNIMWAAQNIVSDFLWESDIQSSDDSLVYYPGKYKSPFFEESLTSFYGFYFAVLNEAIDTLSQTDYITFFDDYSFGRNPLHISGYARHLRWNYPSADDFRIAIITLKNESTVTYNPFYMAIYQDADVVAAEAANNISFYDPTRRTAYIKHPTRPYGVVGITVLGDDETTPISSVELKIGYDETADFADPFVWDILTAHNIDYSNEKWHDARVIIGMGPYSFAPGETLSFAIANPMGWDQDSFDKHVETAITTSKNDWIIPNPPPEAPYLVAVAGNKEVRLIWARNRNYIQKPMPGGLGAGFFEDPDLVAITGRGVADPAPEYTVSSESCFDPSSGIRDWDGYRVYRNLTGLGDIELGDYALVMQWDSTYIYDNFSKIEEKDLDPKTWDDTFYLEYVDRDPSIYNGFTYFYSVSAYDTGDREKVPAIPPAYSSAMANVVVATPKWVTDSTSDPYKYKVMAVPNPYISGQYTTWETGDRKIDFIHLPGKCTVKIYTLSGLLVRTLHHNDDSTAQISWSLTNDKGQLIAPGTYIFRVIPEDKSIIDGKDITGKLMIVR